MSTHATPPPIPLKLPRPTRTPMNGATKLLLGLGSVPGACMVALIALRLCGLLRPFGIPTGGMAPAVSPGDHVLMEGITFLFRQPRRGDIVVFKTDGLNQDFVPPGQFYLKRVAGEPGDQVRISQGKLFINGRELGLTNNAGPIKFASIGTFGVESETTVPHGCYFVLGDNTTNSLDSRFWGKLPRDNILGRIPICYWPLSRVGGVQ